MGVSINFDNYPDTDYSSKDILTIILYLDNKYNLGLWDSEEYHYYDKVSETEIDWNVSFYTETASKLLVEAVTKEIETYTKPLNLNRPHLIDIDTLIRFKELISTGSFSQVN